MVLREQAYKIREKFIELVNLLEHVDAEFSKWLT